MRRFLSRCIIVVCAACALSCDLVGPNDESFFNAGFYGLAPAEVKNLTAAGADKRLALAWEAAERAGYYEVFYGTTPDVHSLTPVTVRET